MAKWKRQNFLLPLPCLALIQSTNLGFPDSSLLPHAAVGGKAPLESTARAGPQLHWVYFLPDTSEVSSLQLSK